MTAPVLFVTGLGRCGASLVMQMLRAGGVPCAGTAPAFEDIPVAPRGVDHDWLLRQGGSAVKWIDPTVTHVHHRAGAAIFIARDPRNQALSQLKLLGVRHTRDDRRRMKALVNRDTVRACVIVQRKFPAATLSLFFEAILRDPARAARVLAAHCRHHGLPFEDTRAAAAVVRRRSPVCAADMALEMQLIEERRR